MRLDPSHVLRSNIVRLPVSASPISQPHPLSYRASLTSLPSSSMIQSNPTRPTHCTLHASPLTSAGDVGGQKTLRPYWRNYFESTDAVVWVVDSSDRMRMADCGEELRGLLGEEVSGARGSIWSASARGATARGLESGVLDH